jgi:S-adenosylmethionine synthetase
MSEQSTSAQNKTRKDGLRTAEHVFRGHPDKVCDQIADAILDFCLTTDPASRTAVEVLGSHGSLMVGGEVTTSAQLDVKAAVQRVYRDIGYRDDLEIFEKIVQQSPEIANGVDTGGAGDQGIMVGYATAETPELLPLELVLARRLAGKLEAEGFGPDGKTQVTLRGLDVVSVTASVQHSPDTPLESVRAAVAKTIASVIGDVPEIHVNPAGSFTIGGFEADAGLTGRKIIIDQYGPQIPAGGGAFSGKDGTKVDRSAAYMARKVACDFVRRGADSALVKIAYAIGVAEPVMVSAEVDGKDVAVTGYDLRPWAIIEQLGLDTPLFEQTARAGHFGHGFAWD